MRLLAIILVVISLIMGTLSLALSPLLVSQFCAYGSVNGCTHETALALSLLFMIAPLILSILGIGLSVVLFKRSAPRDDAADDTAGQD